MKLQALIDLSVILILASSTKGQNWGIEVTRKINASKGMDVIILCRFTYPLEQHTANVQVYWKKPERSEFVIKDNDKNAFIFHTNKTFVLEKYKTKTELIGDQTSGNCSLKIQNIMDNEPNIYVRVTTKSDQYSFRRKYVSIFVSGVRPVTQNPDITDIPLPTFETTTIMGMQQESSSLMYLTIFVPVAALLIIIVVVGIVLCVKKKRSQSCVRQESGYYVNFSRAPLNQAKRETSSKKLDNEKLPHLNAFGEHVYSNMEAPAAPMDQSMDHTDNIYANMDYLKR